MRRARFQYARNRNVLTPNLTKQRVTDVAKFAARRQSNGATMQAGGAKTAGYGEPMALGAAFRRFGEGVNESRKKVAEEQHKAELEEASASANVSSSGGADVAQCVTRTIHQRTPPRSIVREKLTRQQALDTGTYTLGLNKPRCLEAKMIWNPNFPG